MRVPGVEKWKGQKICFKKYWTQEWWQQNAIGHQLALPQRNYYLAAIFRQKCLCKSLGIQLGVYKIPVELKTEPGCFQKAGTCPGSKLTEHSSDWAPETAPFPFKLASRPIWPNSCHQPQLLRDLGRAMPFCAPTDMSPKIDLTMDPEVDPWPSSSIIYLWFRCNPLPRDPMGGTPICTPFGKPAIFTPNCGHQVSLVIQLY